MKFYVIFAFLLAALVAVMATPITPDNNAEDEYVAFETIQTERADRQRRVTCDLLSIKGIAEHSACAANCLSMGKAGGRCENGVCLCRKTTFKELWDKRFN